MCRYVYLSLYSSNQYNIYIFMESPILWEFLLAFLQLSLPSKLAKNCDITYVYNPYTKNSFIPSCLHVSVHTTYLCMTVISYLYSQYWSNVLAILLTLLHHIMGILEPSNMAEYLFLHELQNKYKSSSFSVLCISTLIKYS